MSGNPFRKHLIFIWIMVMCGSLLSVSALAAEQPLQFSPVLKELVCLEEGGENGKLVTAMNVLPDDDGCYRLCVEAAGLDTTKSYWLEAAQTGTGAREAAALLQPAGEHHVAWLEFFGTSGVKRLNWTVFDEEGGTQLYSSLRFSIQLMKQTPYTVADAIAGTARTVMSTAQKAVTVCCDLPVGTVSSVNGLTARLLDADDAVWAETSQLELREAVLLADSRYDGIFMGENPYQVTGQQLLASLQPENTLTPGLYTLQFLDGTGNVLYTYPEVLRCAEIPVAELNGWSESLRGNETGGQDAWLSMELAMGRPEDFQLELWQNGEKCGTSAGWRVTGLTGDGRAQLTYHVPLTQPLNEGAYEIRLITQQEYVGPAALALQSLAGQPTALACREAVFTNDRFANVLLGLAGAEKGARYRAELVLEDAVLSSVMVYPDENGMADLAFVSEDGAPYALEPDRRYRVELYSWEEEAGWQLGCTIEPLAWNSRSHPSFPLSAALDDLWVNYGVAAQDGEVTLQLYRQDNRSCTPDGEICWEPGVQPTLKEGQWPDENSLWQYSAVYLLDGVPVGLAQPQLWVSETHVEGYRALQDWEVWQHELQAASGEHGTVTLYCDGGLTEGGLFPVHSRVYVHAVPQPGYQLDCITVNGEPAPGRAFVLNVDAEVSAVFKKAEGETHAVQVEYTEGYTAAAGTVESDVMAAAPGDTVTVTAQIGEGYFLKDIRCCRRESGEEITLIPGDLPNTWTFSMPKEAVLLTADMQKLPAARIHVTVSGQGTVKAPESAVVGGSVVVTAVPQSGWSLTGLKLKYGGQETDLLLCPGEADGTFLFTVPDAEQVDIQAVFAEDRWYTIADYLSESGTVAAGVSGHTALPGTVIHLEITPKGGYRLVEGSLKGIVTGETGTEALALRYVAGYWVFEMPRGDVALQALFEQIPGSGPGGEIDTPFELYMALGGEGNAALAEDGKTVTLVRPVELVQPLVITGGEMVLDVSGRSLTGPEVSAAIRICEPAKVTLTAEAAGTVGSPGGSAVILPEGKGLTDYLAPYRLIIDPESGQELDPAAWTESGVPSAIRIAKAAPAFPEDGSEQCSVSLDGTAQRGSVTVAVLQPTEDVLVLAALYEENGRLVGAERTVCRRAQALQTLEVSYVGAPARVRLFLLSNDGCFTPLTDLVEKRLTE